MKVKTSECNHTILLRKKDKSIHHIMKDEKAIHESISVSELVPWIKLFRSSYEEIFLDCQVRNPFCHPVQDKTNKKIVVNNSLLVW